MPIKKLCSTLAHYFVRSSVPWQQPLRHLLLSFQNGDAVPEPALEQTQEPIASLLTRLNNHQVAVLLWFSDTLAEEMTRVDTTQPASIRLHKILESAIVDITTIMDLALRQPLITKGGVKTDALESWFTWVNYAQQNQETREPLQQLRDLLPLTAQCITFPGVQNAALDVFRDLLDGFPDFFTPGHMHLLGQLISNHVQPLLLRHLQDPEEDAEGMLYGQMVTSFGNANIPQVVEHPEIHTGSNEIVRLLFEVLRSSGSPGDEDEISKDTIEFWNSYVEYAITTIASKDPVEDLSWVPHTKAVLVELTDLLLSKMKTPDTEIAREWDDDNREMLKEFRSDATDLLLSVYLFLGQEMLQRVASHTLHSLGTKDWRALETALLCVNVLGDSVLEDTASEDALCAIFGSSLFREVADFTQTIPMQTRRTAIDMLGAYGQFIERHAEYLPDAVRFLFTSLQTTLCNTAAKSISSLCSTCRVALTGELPGFLQQYQNFTSGPTSDAYTKDKCIYAIACIIQAQRPESAQIQPLLALLENIERDCQAARDHAAVGEIEMAETMGVTALSCLSSMGKGLQVPDDVPIDLYDDDEARQTSTQPSFWERPEGQVVQQRIMGCLGVLQVVGTSGEAVEAACQVLRSGFAETEPGPFVMPPSVTVNFLQQCRVDTPEVEYVLSTACLLITQHSRSDSRRIDGDVAAIYQVVAGFIQQLDFPWQDPSVAQECIDVVARLFPYYTHILLDESSPCSHQLGTVLDFTLAAIDNNDMMPKRSALDLWSKILKPSPQVVSDSVRQRTQQIISTYGSQIALAVLRQIAVSCLRSELDYFHELLKALITYPAAKSWLEGALCGPTFPLVNQKVGDVEKRHFVLQIMVTRGDGKRMKELVKNFFAACRGTVVSY